MAISAKESIDCVNISNGLVKKDDDDGYIIIAVDSTGIKVTNRGQWMDKKWNIQNRNRGYLKIHVAVNIKNKEILLALEVTRDEKVHDNKMLKKLVNRVLDDSVEPNIMKVKKIESVLADGGAHDTNSNFMYLERRRIKIRKRILLFPVETTV